MARIILSIFAMLSCGIALAGEPDWVRLNAMIDRAEACDDSAVALLVAESVGPGPLGADESQAISLANERVFLNCPVLFLRTLGVREDAGQERLVSMRFGTFHDAWVLGAVLRRLVDHPDVGALVRRRFGSYLDAEVPDGPN